MSKLYKVIKLLSDDSLIVDYGRINGAYEGQNLRVFTPGQDVIFEDKNYGSLDLIKVDVEIVTVYPKFSVCQKIERKKVSTLGLTDFMTRDIETIKSLNFKKEDVSKEIFRDKEPIKLGDLVKLLD